MIILNRNKKFVRIEHIKNIKKNGGDKDETFEY